MKRVVAITGYPGSGKTYLATTKYVPKGYQLADDPSVDSEGFKDRMVTLLRETPHLVVTDPWLVSAQCRAGFLGMVSQAGLDPVADVEWVVFEDSPEKCLINLKHRPFQGKQISNLEAFVRVYTVPEGAEIQPIWVFRESK